jgi:uncharacterized protein (DUF362 family)/Pyruvate/2-oxoacid:ferredoxin oxidoreductase delta subunit
MTAPVSVEPCNTYHPDEVHCALVACLERLAFEMPTGGRVLVKPNATTNNRPEQATGTHFAVVDAVCRVLSDAGCQIDIGDSSAYHFPGFTRHAFETLGFAAVARKYGANLVCIEEQPFRRIARDDDLSPWLTVADLAPWDLVLNLPKLKVHRVTRISGAVKNLMGLVPGGVKQGYHDQLRVAPDYDERFGTLLVDVYLHTRPALSILDAVVGLARDGPAANGDPTPTRFLAASRDALALDVALCRLIGEQIDAVSTLRDALRRGLIDPDAVQVVGQPPEVVFELLAERRRPPAFASAVGQLFLRHQAVRPAVDPARCERCGTCAERCQVDAIRVSEDWSVDMSTCIRCYACPSFCENEALTLVGSPLYTVIQGMRRLSGM